MRSRAAGSIQRTDVLVVGEGLAGTAAALAAAEQGAQTMLVAFQPWLGGQATSQGVSSLDEAVPGDGAPHWSASYRAFRAGIRRWYLDRFAVRERANTADWGDGPAFNPGSSWVSRLSYEPWVAAEVLAAMVAPHVEAGRLTLVRAHSLEAVLRTADTIEGVRVRVAGDPARVQELRAEVIVEATELGDVLALGSVPYRVGAETQGETGEPHARSQPAPACVQPFTFVFFLERRPDGEDHRIPRPPGYDPGRYSMSMERRFFVFDDPVGRQTFWTYRRAVDAANFPSAAYPYDIAQINWAPAGNDFNAGCLDGEPRGCSILDQPAERVDAILRRAREHALGFVYWLQTDVARDDGRGPGYPNLRLMPEVFPGSPDGLAYVPYIREARRVVPATTVREQDIARQGALARARLYADTVGTGWYAMDLHPCAAGEPTLGSRMWNQETRPFQIPFGMLLPDEVDGLLVAGKTAGTTHLTNGAYRVHPVEWHSGEAAGTAAAMAVEERVRPRALQHGRHLLLLQATLVRRRRLPLFWWFDLDAHDQVLYEAAQLLGATRILVGYPDNLDFRAGAEVTQAEFAAVANRLFGPGGHRFEPGPRPKDPVQRAAAVTLLVHAERWPIVWPDRASFQDVPMERAVWSAIETARANGLVEHVCDGWRFHPDRALTRRALALLAYNIVQRRYSL